MSWDEPPWSVTLNFSNHLIKTPYFNQSHHSNNLILHINMVIISWLVPQLNAITFFFTIARFFNRQAIACPSPFLSASKPFLCYLHLLKPSILILFWINNKRILSIISFVLLSFAWIRLFLWAFFSAIILSQPYKHWQRNINMKTNSSSWLEKESSKSETIPHANLHASFNHDTRKLANSLHQYALGSFVCHLLIDPNYNRTYLVLKTCKSNEIH